MSLHDVLETLPPGASAMGAVALMAIVALVVTCWARRRRRGPGGVAGIGRRGGLLGDRAGRLRSKRIQASRSHAIRSAGAVPVVPPPIVGPMAFGPASGVRSRNVPDSGRDDPVDDPVDPFSPEATTLRAEALAARDRHLLHGTADTQAVPLEQRYETDAWVRARVVGRSGRPEFLTLHVAATGVADGQRMLVVDEGDGKEFAPIAAADVDTVVDLATSRPINDVWSWLTAGAKPPSVIMLPARRLSSQNE